MEVIAESKHVSYFTFEYFVLILLWSQWYEAHGAVMAIPMDYGTEKSTLCQNYNNKIVLINNKLDAEGYHPLLAVLSVSVLGTSL